MSRCAATIFAPLLAGVTLSMMPAPIAAAEDPFPDENLEAAVRKALKQGDDAALDDEALRNLYILEAPGKEIADLTGLERCPNLALIDLKDNAIADVKALEGLLNLQSLDLSGNAIESIEPLSGLTKLSSLYLDGNAITDLSPLEGVTRLSTLDLRDNEVTDLGPLTAQTDLRMLFLQGNPVSSLEPLIGWAAEDAEGPKRFAPYLELYLGDLDVPEDQVEQLKESGVRIRQG